MATLRLTQTATWNPRLTNPYRTRYTTAAGRYFDIEAKYLDSPWFIHEITEQGEWMPEGFGAVCFTLAEARNIITAETTGGTRND